MSGARLSNQSARTHVATVDVPCSQESEWCPSISHEFILMCRRVGAQHQLSSSFFLLSPGHIVSVERYFMFIYDTVY